jgi:hypothetical protein
MFPRPISNRANATKHIQAAVFVGGVGFPRQIGDRANATGCNEVHTHAMWLVFTPDRRPGECNLKPIN